MKDTLRQFFESLNREESALAAEVATDRLGLLMRVAVNELDLDLEGVVAPGLPEERDGERSYIMRVGTVRIIKLALQSSEAFNAPTLTIQRNPAYSILVLSLIARAGTIEHGRRVAQLLEAKGAGIDRLADRFRIVLPEQLADLELHERELERLHLGHAKNVFATRYEEAIGSKVGDEVEGLLTDLVYPFRKHFIGYEAHPTLDIYFFGLAYNEVLLAKGFDTFHYSTAFGGATFAHYRLAAMFIVSVAMKHRAYVRALVKKVPSIRIEDVLTVSVETVGYLKGMRDFINEMGARFEAHVPIDEHGVRTVFEVLSVSRRNLSMLDRPGSAIPPLIQCSDSHVIRPLAGANADEIMVYLLNSLQQRFPKEYDQAQRAREGVLQRALEVALREAFPDIGFRGNTKLRRSGKVLTDLDLVVVEPSTDQVVLVQLKHQDPYGADLASMLTRTTRLNEQVSDWLAKVRSWLADASAAELRATLRLPSSTDRPGVRLLVLTRHYAHSLRTVVEEDDTVFANWNQLVTAIARIVETGDRPHRIDALIEALRQLSTPAVEEYLPEPPSLWSVGGLKFTIEQEKYPPADGPATPPAHE